MTSDNQSAQRRESYQNAFAKHGESPQALQWSSYKAIAMRYRELVADLDINNKSILDAGCGMGDGLPYLYAKGSNFIYHGVDITPEFIEVARKRYAESNFEVFDPFTDQLPKKYDIVISSGVMNMNTLDWQNKRKEMIERLFGYAKEALAFNMAGWMQESSEGITIGYAHIPDILSFCYTLTPKIILRNHYSTKDFTIIMFK